jgi:hypothetical protein
VKQIFLRRLLGAIAGGTAAYALVFNLFLLGILTAPRAAELSGGYTLCVTSPDGAGHSDSGSGSGTPAHCPICLGRGPVGGPPPEAASVFERLAIAIRLEFASVVQIEPTAPISAHRARGPPQPA